MGHSDDVCLFVYIFISRCEIVTETDICDWITIDKIQPKSSFLGGYVKESVMGVIKGTLLGLQKFT